MDTDLNISVDDAMEGLLQYYDVEGFGDYGARLLKGMTEEEILEAYRETFRNDSNGCQRNKLNQNYCPNQDPKESWATIDTDALREYMLDYCHMAIQAAMFNLSETQYMSEYQLCYRAEILGVDLTRFQVN
jgi:hypothetical protein